MIRRLLLWFLSLNRFVHLFLAAAYMVGIYLVSGIEIDFDPDVPFIWEVATNLCHVPVYMGLAMLLLPLVRTFFKTDEEREIPPRVMIIVLVAVLFYGISDEWHQSFTGRSATFLDVVSDLIGGIWGIFVWGLVVDRRPTAAFFTGSSCLLAVFSVCAAVFQ